MTGKSMQIYSRNSSSAVLEEQARNKQGMNDEVNEKSFREGHNLTATTLKLTELVG